MTGSHYETLGVSERADPAEIRRAYLDLARRLHPDSLGAAPADERAAGERRMREVNEAWRVLGDPVRRLAYDAGRRRTATAAAAGPAPSFSSGTLFGHDDPEPDTFSRIMRALPWVALLVVLGAIFVFTAYATSNDGGIVGGSRCVRLVGATVEAAGCDDEGARRVEAEVLSVAQCPLRTEPFQPAGRDTALCLEPLPGGAP